TTPRDDNAHRGHRPFPVTCDWRARRPRRTLWARCFYGRSQHRPVSPGVTEWSVPLPHLWLDFLDDPLRVVQVGTDVLDRRDRHAGHRYSQPGEPAEPVDDFLCAHAGLLGGDVDDDVSFADLRGAQPVEHFVR